MSFPEFSNPINNPFGIDDIDPDADINLIDIDGDGDLDLSITKGFSDNVQIRENNGDSNNPSFGDPINNPFGINSDDTSIFAGLVVQHTYGDLDNDGDLDLLVGYGYDNGLFYYENEGDATNPNFSNAIQAPFELTDVGYSASPVFADIDGDGDLDVFVENSYEDLRYFENVGTAENPNFTQQFFSINNSEDLSDLTFIDIDEDEDLDLFADDRLEGIVFLENTGDANNPIFDSTIGNPFEFDDFESLNNSSFGDIDGDGDLDAFIVSSPRNLLFFENSTINSADINGTENDDTLSGTSADDVINGLGGNDRIRGFNGDDLINGNEGNDFLLGSGGNDTLLGDSGRDNLRGGLGADVLDGGEGNRDILNYRRSDAGVNVDLSSNTVSGGYGEGDTISNFEQLVGSNFSDNLTGNNQNNNLRGFDGDDTLAGGSGRNNLFGGGGSDIFVVQENSVSGDLQNIRDFEDGVDQIQLPDGLTFNTGTSSDIVITGDSSSSIRDSNSVVLAVVQDVSPSELDSTDFV